MNTEQLATFLSLTETGNFSQTAKDLIVAQSTISNRIRELEREVGQPLFVRSHSRTDLTQAGKALFGYAEEMVNLERKAIEEANQAAKFTGRLTLGTAYAYYDTELYKIIEAFLPQHPEISLRVVFGHSGRILSECKKGVIDIGFSHHPYYNPEYCCELIAEDAVILVTNAKNLEHCGGLPLSAMKDLPFISSNFLYGSTHNWLFSRHRQFQLEIDIAANVIRFLKQGNWYTLLARKLVEEQIASGELLEIPILDGSIPPVQYYRIYKRTGVSAALQTWLDTAK